MCVFHTQTYDTVIISCVPHYCLGAVPKFPILFLLLSQVVQNVLLPSNLLKHIFSKNQFMKTPHQVGVWCHILLMFLYFYKASQLLWNQGFISVACWTWNNQNHFFNNKNDSWLLINSATDPGSLGLNVHGVINRVLSEQNMCLPAFQ